jgi:hypothetical protein
MQIKDPLYNALCGAPARRNLSQTIEQLGLSIVDKARFESYLRQTCKPQTPIADNEEDQANLADENLRLVAREITIEPNPTTYSIYSAADLSRGNRHENDYALAITREQALSPQLIWSVGTSYTLLEAFFTDFDDDNEIDIKQKFTTVNLHSELTYQSERNPKLIGFTDISFLQNDFTGVEREASITFGGGYAIWGSNYHADCEVLKYSAGAGRRDRALFDSNNEKRNYISHKVSLKYPVTDTICVSFKQSLQQILGHSDQNRTTSSIDSRFMINDTVSVTARYLYSDDQGAQIGFDPVDERLRLGIEIEF